MPCVSVVFFVRVPTKRKDHRRNGPPALSSGATGAIAGKVLLPAPGTK